MKILSIIGTRPQFIKHVILQKKLLQSDILEFCIDTNQHNSPAMNEDLISELGLKIDVKLPLFSANDPISTLCLILQNLQNLKLDMKSFDYVLVYGDTISTMAGALFASYHHRPLVHIEAGLRSHLPMLEESNRIVSDALSDIAFAPDIQSLAVLKTLNIKNSFLSGDLLFDSFVQNTKNLNPKIYNAMKSKLPSEFVLLSIHRRELLSDREALRLLLLDFASSKITFVLPMHHSLELTLKRENLKLPSNILALPAFSYLQSLAVLLLARAVATDSGGLQREAHFASRGCVVLRKSSEWNMGKLYSGDIRSDLYSAIIAPIEQIDGASDFIVSKLLAFSF